MKKYKSIIQKVIRIIIGSVILGTGIAIAILTGFGGDAISVFSEGLGKSLGITIGAATLVYYGIFCIPIIFLDKKQLGIGTIVSPVISAIVMDMILLHVSLSYSPVVKILLLVIGITMIGIGLGIYVSANLGRSSYDAFVVYISENYKSSIGLIKSLGDLLLCVVGFILGGTLGIGPILAIVMIGPVLQQTLNIINKYKKV